MDLEVEVEVVEAVEEVFRVVEADHLGEAGVDINSNERLAGLTEEADIFVHS